MKNRLRILRAEKDWTQSQLAEAVGVSRQAIIAVENGKYDPALPLAFKLARAFGKNVEEVFVWDVESPQER
jgi:putative transcriptional regulator